MEQLINILNQIAPYLQMATYISGVILIVAVIAFLLRIFTGAANSLLKLSARLLILFGIVFMIYEAADMIAGLPTPTVMVIDPMRLWMVALILLVIGILFRLMSTLRPTR